MIENLKTLCEIDGISGREDAVAEEIQRQISPYCDCYRDPLGNLIAKKQGKQRGKYRLMISAHMDEVGLIVTDITSEGMLRFAAVGGVDPRVLIGRRVRIAERVFGLIGTKAVHLQTAEERETAVPIDKLYIDIGATAQAEAEKTVKRGDAVCFDTPFFAFGDGFLKGKAIDDRFGCWLMIELIRSELPYDTTFLFSTQEEIGLRGGKVGAYAINPDFAFVCEATTAADVAGVSGEKKVCSLGKGAVVGFMDQRTVYDRALYQLAFSVAEEKGIPCQTKTMVAGGNDSGAIHTARGGVRTLAVSIPCRYLHSPSCVIKESDAEACLSLVKELIARVQEC